MSRHEDFLLEIQTEELPPKSLTSLGSALQQAMEKQLQKAQLSFGPVKYYATPRRLALLIEGLATEQAAQTVERKGPALTAAFDAEGKPTPACLGFARSCGVEPTALMTIKNPGGEWLVYREELPGQATRSLLPAMIQQALAALPIPKRMRWGENSEAFVRPVHSLLVLLGKDIVETTILGHPSDRLTYGHRFHHPKALKVSQPKGYADLLEEKGYVIADFDKRQALIQEQCETLVKQKLGKEVKILFQEALLREVTGIVEWPVAICGHFDPLFLSLPAPVLISAMQDHQRYFPIVDQQGKLQPYFAAVMNINSEDLARVVAGNERVLRARLSDANFFFEKDKKRKLEERVDSLKGIVFQAKLGSLYDKTQRLTQIASYLADLLKADARLALRAATLAKADLSTEMVGEFPELQGVMGYYYATHDGEPSAVAQAIVDHYKPRFSGDILPEQLLGSICALADRVDTLVGVFGINQIPTGDKDPYGLRRAAMGILRILIEKQLDLDLLPLLNYATAAYPPLENKEGVPQLLRFMQDRLKAWYLEQGIAPDVFAAVAALPLTRPYDFHRRIQAVQLFKGLPAAESLALANKRVSNILDQYTEKLSLTQVDASLFESEEEKELAQSLEKQSKGSAALYQEANYVELMRQLADLRGPIDKFFDKVLVMVDDKKKRENRLLLLSQLRALFLQVADIAFLVANPQEKNK